VPFFFKQWGGRNKKKTGRKLEGRTWDEMPLVREVCCTQQARLYRYGAKQQAD